ncbi:MAG TPA: hypothetical protein PKZ84_18530 [Anaerolineae bacterium]|nr:hypothetical protein [Anaerolineae bacterium]HQI86597.1 hypothetical protein [Anaerolineae bacterium]
MDVGLLWHDSGAEDLAWKLARAAKRYRDRFGDKPNVCYVNPSLLPEGDRKVDGILVRSSPRVLRHHFWLGREKAETIPV